jgi:hypothetical protein
MTGRQDVTSWFRLIVEKLVLIELVRKFPTFMDPEDLSPF